MDEEVMDEDVRSLLRNFKRVIEYVHEICGTKPKPLVVVGNVVSMYVQVMLGAQNAQAIRDTGPGIRLDFSKFTK